MASISIAVLAFMLVIATATAKQDPMNPWKFNEDIAEEQDKIMRDDGEDGDRDGNGDKDREVKLMKLWNREKVINNERRFKAEIDYIGKHSIAIVMIMIIVLQLEHVSIFPQPCMLFSMSD